MDLALTEDDRAFRAEIRAFLGRALPADMAETHRRYGQHSFEQMMRWHRILYEKGWVAVTWPVEHGGTGWSAMQQYVFDSEAMLAGAPRLRPFALKMIGPVLIRYGSDAQRDRFLPRMLSGEDYWCQGFSEPDAGSDLASIRTRAVREGDVYRVDGQKMWTTTAQHANWMFTLVRSDPGAAKPQAGISLLLIPLDARGVEVQPIRTIDGDHHVNAVFLDGVEVPVAQRVGEENAGWTYAKYLLSNERASIANVGQAKAELQLLKRLAARPGPAGVLVDDPAFAAKLADLEADFLSFEVTNLRMLSTLVPGGDPGAMASLLKLRGSEIQQRIAELAMEAAGPAGIAWPGTPETDDRYGLHRWLFSRAFTIFGGSSEVMRDIVAKQELRL